MAPANSTSLRTLVDRLLPEPVRRVKASAGVAARYLMGRFAQVEDAPTFVLGNQKSGTTVIAAALAHAMQSSVTLDIRDLQVGHLTGLYQGTYPMDDFVRRYRPAFSSSVVKEPGLTFARDALAERFPDARFLLIVRDPRDNIRSILNRLRLPGDADQISSEATDMLHPIWRSILMGDSLQIRADHYITCLAERWNQSADVYLNHKEDTLLLRYEDFQASKVSFIEETVEQLGAPIRADAGDIVNRQFQSKGNRSISWEDFFSKRNLRKIERTCERRMQMLGYEPTVERYK